jgi:hypothetical protein
MTTGNTGPAVDFGPKVKDAVKALMEVCPEAFYGWVDELNLGN